MSSRPPVDLQRLLHELEGVSDGLASDYNGLVLLSHLHLRIRAVPKFLQLVAATMLIR